MTKKESILIVTDKFDPHADTVIIKLREMGHQPVRLHPADFPIHNLVTLSFHEQRWQGELSLPKGNLNIDAIKSVWWRRPEPAVMPTALSKEEQVFARKEVEHTLGGLWSIMDCYWMSFPPYIRQASNKIEQLQRATQLGFRVPRTLVTNDPDRVRAFSEECGGQIVYKTLAAPILGVTEVNDMKYGSLMVHTTLITDEHLNILDTVRTVPCQFQELIPKRLELRVTIIGDDIFTCEIHSQENEQTSLDWRHYEVSIPYTKGTLPPAIEEKCFALTRSYGLNYSAMDLIVTPEGEYVFLENNPNGQCFFIQELIPEFKMAEAIAACLVRGSN